MGAVAPAPEGLPTVVAAATFAAILIAVFRHRGLYRVKTGVLHLEEMASTVKGLAMAVLLFVSIAFVSGMEHGRPGTLLLFAALTSGVVFTDRRVVAGLVQKLRPRLGEDKRVLIYGCGETGRLVMKKLVQAAYLGRTVVGFVDDYAAVGSKLACRVEQLRRRVRWVPVLGRSRDLPKLIERHQVDELLVTTPASQFTFLPDLQDRLGRGPVDVAFVPQLGSVRADQLEVHDIGAVPLLRPSRSHARLLYRIAKRVLDVAIGLVLMVLVAPVWLLAALAIWLESGGPILFRQWRVGRHGRRFVMYKFRTLRQNADPYTPSTSVRDDRATRVGAILRATGLDEIPQLLNVLRGDMSLVGPRPEMPFLAAEYGKLELLRLDVKPGITGVWQLSPDREGAAIHENLEYDLYYLRNRGLLLDLLLLVETGFFTLEVVAMALYEAARGRGTSRHTGSGPESPAASATSGRDRRHPGYTLLALDQRLEEGLPESWRTCLPAAVSLARRRTLRVLAARHNVPALDRLFGRDGEGAQTGGSDVQYVPCEDRSLAQAVAQGANVVITDLPYIREWVRGLPVSVLTPSEFAVRGGVQAEDGRPTGSAAGAAAL